jgi:hypothetical protein
MREQYEKTKQEYIKMASLKQLVKEKEQENKALMGNVEEMKGELNRLTEENEGLRQEVEMMGRYESKVEMYEQ